MSQSDSPIAPPTGSPAGTPGAAALPWLAHVPVPLFALTMGLAGLGLAWRAAGHVLAWPAMIGEAILALSAFTFLATAALYGTKAVRFPQAVKAEFQHPVRANFFPTIPICLVLMATAAQPHWPGLALPLWCVGVVAQVGLSLAILGRWIVRNTEIHHSNPSWFIPVVGNILAPVAGVPLGQVEVSWFLFSIGLVLWVLLFVIVFYRIVFHDQMPTKFLPTLFILMAPPGVGYLSLVALNGGEMDMLARVLFFFGLFLALLLATMARLFASLPFSIAWAAYTFPTASMAAAALRYHGLTGGAVSGAIALVLLGLATVIITAVILRSLKAIAAGQMFLPEG
ncbi:MAG: SLAC1 anion channel family protein [Rhodobacterales bacterium]|nr:SLAC1 anion channel family protein [Rhodobacterales bacterium]